MANVFLALEASNTRENLQMDGMLGPTFMNYKHFSVKQFFLLSFTKVIYISYMILLVYSELTYVLVDLHGFFFIYNTSYDTQVRTFLFKYPKEKLFMVSLWVEFRLV